MQGRATRRRVGAEGAREDVIAVYFTGAPWEHGEVMTIGTACSAFGVPRRLAIYERDGKGYAFLRTVDDSAVEVI